MPPKSTDIDAAIAQRLRTDPALQALLPDGVWFDAAPPGATAFVRLVLVSEVDVATFGGWRESEDALYHVEAVAFDKSADTVNAAANQIDALLENVELIVPAYTWMATFREGRFRTAQADPVDASLRWQVSGGNYRVQMAPVWPAVAGKEQTS
jgi:Protein of unknown function (DUF3168)